MPGARTTTPPYKRVRETTEDDLRRGHGTEIIVRWHAPEEYSAMGRVRVQDPLKKPSSGAYLGRHSFYIYLESSGTR